MINSRSLDELHPAVKRGAAELIRRMAAKGYQVLVTSTYRDAEAQNALYAQGRTAPGKIVTNAKAGQSIHNHRLAFDICKNVKGQEYSDEAFFREAGAVWTLMGGEWGGTWASFPDRPHMQFTGGLTLSQLQQGKTLDTGARMPWEAGTVQKQPVTENAASADADTDRDLLCKIVHHEARGEDEKGKMLVVYVILNRVASKGKGFPEDNVRDTIYKPGAFSPVKIPGFEYTVPTPEVVAAVNKALSLEDAISQGALYFGSEADMEAPFFANALADGRILKLFQHGGHWFLK